MARKAWIITPEQSTNIWSLCVWMLGNDGKTFKNTETGRLRLNLAELLDEAMKRAEKAY